MQREYKTASKPGTKKKAAQRKTESIEIERSSKRKNKRKLPEENSELPPPAAKKQKAGKGKAMNKKERDTLTLLDSIDSSIFKGVICDKVKEQIIPEKLKQLACHLLENEQPLKAIIVYHRHCFAVLYTECKKGPDPFFKNFICVGTNTAASVYMSHCSAHIQHKMHCLKNSKYQKSRRRENYRTFPLICTIQVHYPYDQLPYS